MTTNNYFVKYISTSNQKDLLDSSSEQNIYQGSKFPLVQWSVTTQTVSRPAELSFALVHGTTNCHEKSEAFSHLTLSMGPTPLSSSLSEGQ